jgi:hypothetical protein
MDSRSPQVVQQAAGPASTSAAGATVNRVWERCLLPVDSGLVAPPGVGFHAGERAGPPRARSTIIAHERAVTT